MHRFRVSTEHLMGLRGVAILMVLIFHAGFSWGQGGFTGVDVFFVLSGYLITGKLLEEDFSHSSFYRNRAKRILPPLVLTLLVCCPIAYAIFSPNDLMEFGHEVLTSSLSSSNFYFLSKQGYFDQGSETKPLFHLWSLALEMQFYLLWPIVVTVILRVSRKYFFESILVIGLLSLALSDSSRMSFFLLPFRIFEFAIGALCLAVKRNRFQEFLGFVLIGSAFIFFDKTTKFPSPMALIPCLGTALVIAGGSRLLQNRFLHSLGASSYSIYLIHWPLIVFYAYLVTAPISMIESSALILLAVLLGYLIEKSSKFLPLPLVSLSLAGLIIGSALTIQQAGWPHRFPGFYQLSHDQILAERERYWTKFQASLDEHNKEKTGSVVAVIGNSHAMDLIYSLIENKSSHRYHFIKTSHYCPNFGNSSNGVAAHECSEVKKRVLAEISSAKVDRIYLHDNWASYNVIEFINMMMEVRSKNKAPIHVFGPKMQFSVRVPNIAHTHQRLWSLNDFAQTHRLNDIIPFNDKLRNDLETEHIRARDIHFIDFLRIQCGSKIETCDVISRSDFGFLYFDYSHFTLQGAREFGQLLKAKHPELF